MTMSYKCALVLALASASALALALALTLASVVNYDCKWCHILEHHLLTTLESHHLQL